MRDAAIEAVAKPTTDQSTLTAGVIIAGRLAVEDAQRQPHLLNVSRGMLT